MQEKIVRIVGDAIVFGDDGPFLDLELFTRMLLHRAIPYRDLNRSALFMELQVVRDEQHVQGTRVDQARKKVETGEPVAKEAADLARDRLEALIVREQQILDQLWPIS